MTPFLHPASFYLATRAVDQKQDPRSVLEEVLAGGGERLSSPTAPGSDCKPMAKVRRHRKTTPLHSANHSVQARRQFLFFEIIRLKGYSLKDSPIDHAGAGDTHGTLQLVPDRRPSRKFP